MGADLVCALCAFTAQDANEMDGHIRNMHGWPTDGDPIVRALPARCEYALPGLGRCVDCSGTVHGHHFRPGQLDPDLVLSLDEARELNTYMRAQFLNKNKWPRLDALLSRLDEHLRATA